MTTAEEHAEVVTGHSYVLTSKQEPKQTSKQASKLSQDVTRLNPDA